MWGRIQQISILVFSFVLGFSALADQSTTHHQPKPLLSTGVTGSVRGAGADDPQYVLSFVPVQRLLLTAVQHPINAQQAEQGLAGIPVTINDLVRLELLRKENSHYRLNYLLLTVQDQRSMYRITQEYGKSLAAAFRAHAEEFEAIANHYSSRQLHQKLLFDLVAGAALNWGGLDLTTQLGYRVKPPRHANGETYLIHSGERGAKLDFTGLYLDSETACGSKLCFTTFGDGESLPRLRGWPDVFDGLDNAVEDWKEIPNLHAALRSEYITYILVALDDAGEIMDGIASGIDTKTALSRRLSIPSSRLESTLQLLLATGYLKKSVNRYQEAIPILTAHDKPIIDGVLMLSRKIMTKWLRKNYPSIKYRLKGLSPMRNGVPFSLAFSEVWHYVFGFATKDLAESGFYANPRKSGEQFAGYLPLVWQKQLLTAPGS